jgi:hypothetical protein
MAHSETIMISATPEEVTSLMREMKAYLAQGRSAGLTEIRIGELVVDIEELDIYEGFTTAADVYGTSRQNARDNARKFFDLLSKKSTWRLALGFDENESPVIERPAIRPGRN